MTTEPILYTAKDLTENLRRNLLARTASPDFGITSLPMFNDKIFGLPRRKLTIIGARPSHGKTAFMSQLAADIALAGAKVLILSYEESIEQLLERCFCNLFRIDNRKLIRGGFKEYEPQYNNFVALTARMPLALTDCAGKSCKELHDMIEKMPANYRPDVIFVDYIQAIKGLGSLQQGAERSALDEYIKYFRAMCVHYNMAGVLMSQVNRSTELGRTKDTGPQNHQLKGTGFLEEHADLIILLHWLYKMTGKKADFNRVWLNVSKNKSGETGRILLNFEPEFYRYSDAKNQEINEEADKANAKRAKAVNEDVQDPKAEEIRQLFGGDYVEPEQPKKRKKQ